jgi:hypothetical protein
MNELFATGGGQLEYRPGLIDTYLEQPVSGAGSPATVLASWGSAA